MEQLNASITERRRITRNKMFRYIYSSQTPVSKQQLASDMGYSLPTVQQNIAELLEAGLIRPGEIRRSTGGRPAIGYTVDEKIRYAVGIAVDASSLRMIITDIRQTELGFKTVALKSEESGKIGEQIADELEIFLAENSIEREKVLGVGITFPGVIDREKDTIVLSPTLKMKDISLSAEERSIGGLGIYLVRQTMDIVTYEYTDSHNVLTVTKKW